MTSMANVVVVSSAHIMQHGKDIMKKVRLQNSQNPGDKDKCTDKQTCPVKLTMRSDLIVDRLSTESRNQPHSRTILVMYLIISGNSNRFNNGDFLLDSL